MLRYILYFQYVNMAILLLDFNLISLGKRQFLYDTSFWKNFKYLYYSDGEGNGTPLQYSCLKNPMDGGAWKAAICGVAEGKMWLSDFPFTFHFHALEKEMANHSSALAWRIPGTGEPSGLPSMGLHKVGHDWSDLAAAAATVTIQLNSNNICTRNRHKLQQLGGLPQSG